MSHWAAQYIGLPWEKDAEGPEAFYCWSFFRMVQARHYGRDLPHIPNPSGLRDIIRLFRDHPEHSRWDRVGQAFDGDGVQMRRGVEPLHIGVWIGDARGGVLHCAQGDGVVYQRPDALAINGWQIEGNYRFRGDR